jgi:hypothetical protein
MTDKKEMFLTIDNGAEIVSFFREQFAWFEQRYSLMDIEHKTVFMKMLDNVPQLGLHLMNIFDKNLNEKGQLPDEVFRVTSQEADLLMLLALPYDDAEMVLTDDTGILDSRGNKILSGGKKSFKVQ